MKKIAQRLIAAFLSHSRLIAASAICSVIVMLVSYSVDVCSPYSVGGELSAGQWIERWKAMNYGVDNVPDSILFINVAYDKQLVDYDAPIDETDDSCDVRLPAGTTPITDRNKLLSFLSMARERGTYRYIMMDVRMEQGLSVPEVDDSLFSLIATMPRIVIPRHRKIELADGRLYAKAAYSDYMTTFLETNFTKYPIANGDRLSMPATMYADLSGNEVKPLSGPLWLDSGSLSRGIMFLTFPVRFSKWVADDGSFNYYNLGEDILNVDQTPALIDGRIIVIGDFVNDVHSTYVGILPGAVINYNAYVALCEGHHHITLLAVIVLFLVYLAMSAFLLSGKSLLDYLPFSVCHRSGIIRFAISFLGISTTLWVFAMLYYIVLGEHLNILLPSFCFTLLATFVKSRVTNIKL